MILFRAASSLILSSEAPPISMNKKEKDLLKGIRSGSVECKKELFKRYQTAVERYIRHLMRLGLIQRNTVPADQKKLADRILHQFIEFVRDTPILPVEFSIRQLLYLQTVQQSVGAYLWNPRWRVLSYATHTPKSVIALSGAGLLSYLHFPELRLAEHTQRLIIVEGDERITPRFLSLILVPYIEAISSIQRVCNAVLNRPAHNIAVRSISQFSPTDIKLVDAAEAINAVKEDIIPWRRKNAQKLAELKQQELAAEIKKKEAEALEIERQSSREDAKLQAEVNKMKEEADQMRLDNEKRRFELQKAKLELALEIVSKMEPDLPLAEKYAHAMQLLPSIDTIANSPIEPKLLP